MHWDAVITGVTLKVGEREGLFGRANTSGFNYQELTYEFSLEQPLIGLYGFKGANFINGLGFFTLDTVAEKC